MHARWVVGTVGIAAALTACTPATVPPPASSAAPPAAPPASASAEPTPRLDLTEPGVARRMVRELVQASGSTRVIMVSVKTHEAAVSVLTDGAPHTWAYRDGVVHEIASDLAYVDQAAFDPERFDLDDVGALFRTAAAVSGSTQSRELQIVDTQRVDHDVDDIKMSVSTNPETRTVFFNSDGTLVPTLDFSTPAGLAEGLAEAVGDHLTATAVGVGSDQGAYVDFVASDATTLARRQRLPRLAVSVLPRPGSVKAAPFDPRTVDPGTIWKVLQTRASAGTWTPATTWSVTVDAASGRPLMHFVVGTETFTTTLDGALVP